jgi:hypothetical protein
MPETPSSVDSLAVFTSMARDLVSPIIGFATV